MDDEIRQFKDGRPDVPAYRAEARALARERLLRATRRGFRIPRPGWQVVAAFGVTVTLVEGVAVALSGGTGPDQVATAAAYFPELDPEPGQFILIESQTMYGAFTVGEAGEESRHLYGSHRKFYQSVDGRSDGLLMTEGRGPLAWPGQDLPATARTAPKVWRRIASCPELRGDDRDDYAYLSTLPADPGAMRTRFYREDAEDAGAFDAAGELIRETYMPRAQRQAVFEAIKTIPGVQVAEGVEDSAGRAGVALGREADGVLTQLIFDPATYAFLGERGVVTQERIAEAPVGSVLAHTAELSVAVVDELPDVRAANGDGSCTPEPAADPPSVSDTPSPAEPAPTETPPTPEKMPADAVPAERVPADAVPVETPPTPEKSPAETRSGAFREPSPARAGDVRPAGVAVPAERPS